MENELTKAFPILMKFDKDGVVCGLGSTEHIKGFLSDDESNRYFHDLERSLTWAEISWMGFSILTFHYHDLERRSRRRESLEELILSIEDVFETAVSRVECNFYMNGTVYRHSHRDYKGKHIFVISLGSSRKTAITKQDSPEGKVFSMKHGDLLYTSPNINTKCDRSILKDDFILSPHIELVFFSDSPYINRSQHLRYMNVLGVGKIPVWFEGPSNEWTKDLTAAILPSSFEQLLGATMRHPQEGDTHLPTTITVEI